MLESGPHLHLLGVGFECCCRGRAYIVGCVPREIREQRRAYETAVQSVIREGIRDRVFRSVDPKVASFAVLGAVNWTVKWYRPEGRENAESIGEAFADLLVRGLLRAPESTRRKA